MAPLRALIVTVLYPTEDEPGYGRFVFDQVEALRRIPDVEVDVFAFPRGGSSYVRSARELRRRFRAARYDVVHAHYGLSAWTAILGTRGVPRVVTLHGTDVHHPRAGPVTRAALPFVTLTAAVSADLAARLPARRRGTVAVLPCGVDVHRFHPLDRAEARRELDLDADGRLLLFPADPARAEKRHDRARALAAATGAQLLELGGVHPEEVPLRVNAANAVVVPSAREGFGLAVLEALACDVPVLATPVGVAPFALAGVPGTLCAPFDVDAWAAAVEPHLDAPDPRVQGRARAELLSAERMAERVVEAWRSLL